MMNDHERDEDEKLAAQLLAPLRDLRAPDKTRQAIRQAMHGELSASRRRRAPLWRQGIYVPLPAAALFVLALVGLLAWGLQLPRESHSQQQPKPPVPEVHRTRGPERVRRAVADSGVGDSDSYNQTVYLAGFGPLSSVTSYQFPSEENSNE